jgi:rsbT co-antagonist protein RsbR
MSNLPGDMALEEENQRLRARVQELEQQLAEQRESAGVVDSQRSVQELQIFHALSENAPDGIAVVGLDGLISYANPSLRQMLGYGNSLIGKPMDECFAPEEPIRPSQVIGEVLANGSWQGLIAFVRKDRSVMKAQISVFGIYDADGQPISFPGVVHDITAQLRGEEERQRLQEEVIAAQQATLRELSTPLIPLADDLVALPLVGSIDSARAQLIIETLLEGVTSAHATTAIIDITGVPVVDTQVASALLRAAQAVRLLGAQVILTGIRPEVAQTLVGLGVSLGDIITRSTLQSGIAYAITQQTKLPSS